MACIFKTETTCYNIVGKWGVTMNEDIIKNLYAWSDHFKQQQALHYKDLPAIELYMDQVVSVVGSYLSFYFDDTTKFITSSIINNYVKLGVIPAPVKKKYSKEHIAKLIIICVLKQVLPISSIKTLIDFYLEKMSIEQFFDLFCKNQQEILYQSITETEKIQNESSDSQKPTTAVLDLAIKASACKLLTEKVLTAYDKTEESLHTKKTKK